MGSNEVFTVGQAVWLQDQDTKSYNKGKWSIPAQIIRPRIPTGVEASSFIPRTYLVKTIDGGKIFLLSRRFIKQRYVTDHESASEVENEAIGAHIPESPKDTDSAGEVDHEA